MPNVSPFNFEGLLVTKPIISLFASGFSILNLKSTDLAMIKDKSYVINTNYPLSLAYPEFSPDLLVWSDYKPTQFMEEYYKKIKKNCLWCSRPEAFKKDWVNYNTYRGMDYWFSDSYYKLKSNFTLFWILQLLKKFNKGEKILLFGFDGYVPETIKPQADGFFPTKWYDLYTNHDKGERKSNTDISLLNHFVTSMETEVRENPTMFTNVFNCNPQSRVKDIKKISYAEALS